MSLLRVLRVICVVAASLSIVGLTKNMSPEALKHPSRLIKVSMILYIVSWALLLFILLLVARQRAEIEAGERRILLAVALSVVFLLVRLLYAVLLWFATSAVFNFMDGSNTAMLLMSVLPEIAVVIVCLLVGMTLSANVRQSHSPEPYQRTQYGYVEARGMSPV